MRRPLLLVLFGVTAACSVLTSLSELSPTNVGGADSGLDAFLGFETSTDGRTDTGQGSCDSGLSQCGAGCFDLASDKSHCGSCSRACDPSDTCSASLCGRDVVQIAASGPSGNHTCAITQAGALYCWGHNTQGELGDGTMQTKNRATLISRDNTNALLLPIKSVAPGGSHTCMWDGTRVLCNGSGIVFQLGSDQLSSALLPTVTAFSAKVDFLAAGPAETCTGADVGCWGVNNSGQLGHAKNTNGDVLCYNASTFCRGAPVSTGLKAKQLAVGSQTVCALLLDGSISCWGSGAFGALGNGFDGNVALPTQVPGFGPGSALGVSAGGIYFCALKSDTTVACWGLGAVGPQGGADTCTSDPCALKPNPMPNFKDVVSLTSGGQVTCAIKKDGSTWCWGFNVYGTIGNGDYTDHDTPVLNKVTNAAQIACGASHCCALTTEHKVVCWGNNSSGQLGNADDAGSASPIPQSVLGLP